MSRVVLVIPARLGSTRFPRKLLHQHKGKSLLEHVWREAARVDGVDRVVVAADSPELARETRHFGGEVVPTSRSHRTGTDRVAEIAKSVRADIYINVQGDNLYPFASDLTRALAGFTAERTVPAGTLAYSLRDDVELFNPDRVKLVVDQNGYAAWFSRYPIPFVRDKKQVSSARSYPFLGHVGIYLYRRAALQAYATLKQTPAEKAESLEQLRWLEWGNRMRVYPARKFPVAIDTEADLGKIRW